MMKFRIWPATGLLVCAAVVCPAVGQVPMGLLAAAPTNLATLTSTTAAQTLAFAAAGNAAYDITLTGNTAFALSGGTSGQFQSMTLVLREATPGGFVPSLPSTIQWASGAPPNFNTQIGAVNTVILSTSDGGKTITGMPGGIPIGIVAGTARDAAAAIAAETAAAAAAAGEATRAQAAEANLLPKTTTLAGLSVSASPSAAQLAAALPPFSVTAPGLVPAPPSNGSNLVLGQGGWAAATGGGNVSTDAAGTISAQVVRAAAGAVNRTLSARASDVFNARDFGAVGNGNAAAIGTSYGSTLAALAGYTTSTGVTPFSWATNPLYGLTFTMTTTSAQSGAGATVNFQETNQGNGIWGASYLAPWQDPAHGNLLVQPGMQVSGSCIASGTTVSSIVSTPVRQGELLPGATDYANSTALAVGAFVASPGGKAFYKVTTAGTSAAAGSGPTGTGKTITDGTVVFAYATPAEYANLPSGALVLSAPTSSACASGTVITFTIAPAQLQALTLDWLGIQTAIAQAVASANASGGQVYIPSGIYELNYPLMNTGGSASSFPSEPAISLFGDGRLVTELVWSSDLGQDMCAIGEPSRTNNGINNNTTYRDFSMFGPSPASKTPGISFTHMDGLCMGQADLAQNMLITNFHAGIQIERDHQTIQGVSSSGNAYGILFGAYAQSSGNQLVEGGALFDEIAGIGFTTTNAMDSSYVGGTHFGFGPYAFYNLPGTPNVTASGNGGLTDSILISDYFESLGAAVFKSSVAQSKIDSDTFIGMGAGGLVNGNAGFNLPDGNGGLQRPRAEVDVVNYTHITHIGTAMAPYGSVSVAAVYASQCTNDNWYNDEAMIYGIQGTSIVPTPQVPALNCNAVGSQDHVNGSTIDFIQVISGSSPGVFNTNAGVPVSQHPGYSGGGIYPYTDGQALVGITAITCPDQSVAGQSNGACPIIVAGTSYLNVPGNGSAINNGQPVKASAMGFTGGMAGVVGALDGQDSIGATLYSCTTSCYIQLGAMPSGNSVGLGQTAGTSGLPFAITTRVTQFTTVASGGAATLPVAGAPGDTVTIYNDGANALTLSVPGGGTFLPGGTTVTLPAGSTGSYRRISNTQWH